MERLEKAYNDAKEIEDLNRIMTHKLENPKKEKYYTKFLKDRAKKKNPFK